MTNMVQVFTNKEFGSVRTIERTDGVWFVGKDVAEILGYKNQNRDIVRHIDEEDRLMIEKETQYHFGIVLGQRGGWIINETGLYSLIISSKLPSAKCFKRWITSEVLPCIRKNGMYMNQEVAQEAIEDPSVFLAKALHVANDVIKNHLQPSSSKNRRFRPSNQRQTIMTNI